MARQGQRDTSDRLAKLDQEAMNACATARAVEAAEAARRKILDNPAIESKDLVLMGMAVWDDELTALVRDNPMALLHILDDPALASRVVLPRDRAVSDRIHGEPTLAALALERYGDAAAGKILSDPALAALPARSQLGLDTPILGDVAVSSHLSARHVLMENPAVAALHTDLKAPNTTDDGPIFLKAAPKERLGIIAVLNYSHDLAAKAVQNPVTARIRSGDKLGTFGLTLAHVAAYASADAAVVAVGDPDIRRLGESEGLSVGQMAVMRHQEAALYALDDIEVAKEVAHEVPLFRPLGEDQATWGLRDDHKTTEQLRLYENTARSHAALKNGENKTTLAHMAALFHEPAGSRVLDVERLGGIKDSCGNPATVAAVWGHERLAVKVIGGNHVMLANTPVPGRWRPALFPLMNKASSKLPGSLRRNLADQDTMLATLAVGQHARAGMELCRHPYFAAMKDSAGCPLLHAALMAESNRKLPMGYGDSRMWSVAIRNPGLAMIRESVTDNGYTTAHIGAISVDTVADTIAFSAPPEVQKVPLNPDRGDLRTPLHFAAARSEWAAAKILENKEMRELSDGGIRGTVAHYCVEHFQPAVTAMNDPEIGSLRKDVGGNAGRDQDGRPYGRTVWEEVALRHGMWVERAVMAGDNPIRALRDPFSGATVGEILADATKVPAPQVQGAGQEGEASKPSLLVAYERLMATRDQDEDAYPLPSKPQIEHPKPRRGRSR